MEKTLKYKIEVTRNELRTIIAGLERTINSLTKTDKALGIEKELQDLKEKMAKAL